MLTMGVVGHVIFLLKLVADIGFFRLAMPPSALLMETGL